MKRKLLAAIVVVSCVVVFSACHFWGYPHVHLEIYGTVVNEQNEPIKGILIDFVDRVDKDGVYTNKKGWYDLKAIGIPKNDIEGFYSPIDTIVVTAIDESGVYKNASQKVPVEYVIDSKQKDYATCEGGATAQVNFVLTKK